MTEEFDLKSHAENMIEKSKIRRQKTMLDIRKNLKLDNVSDDEVIKIAKESKIKIPKVWSDKQARCVLYWQNGVRKRLREKAKSLMQPKDFLLDIPEANGVWVVETMYRVGVEIKTHHPDLVKKVMLVGRPKVN